MMGPEKLGTIRAQVRKSFKMSDAELFAWFNKQIEDAEGKYKGNQTAIETLRLLRDGLVEEAKRPKPRRKTRSVAGGRKNS